MAQLTTQITTDYDGSCPLCSKEIAHYQRMDGNQQVRWIDLTQAADELAAMGLDTVTAMRRLHVRDVDGRPLDWFYAEFADWRFRRRCVDDACAATTRRSD